MAAVAVGVALRLGVAVAVGVACCGEQLASTSSATTMTARANTARV
jgi:hypothetical protein